jgi:hypothetical protein
MKKYTATFDVTIRNQVDINVEAEDVNEAEQKALQFIQDKINNTFDDSSKFEVRYIGIKSELKSEE